MWSNRFNRRIILFAAVIVGVGVLLFFWSFLAGDGNSRPADSRDELNEVQINPADGLPVITEDPAEALEYFRKWAKYPPFSRPLVRSQIEETQPFDGVRFTNRVVITPPSDCQRTAQGEQCLKPAVYSDISCEISPQSAISVGQGDFYVYLNCTKFENPEKTPEIVAKLEIQQTKVEHLLYDKSMEKASSLPPVYSGDDGTNGDAKKGDGIYTILVRPGPNDWGEMYLTVEFTVNGMRHREVATWYSTPHVVARFEKAGITHRLADGHLKITVPVIVDRAGFYEFAANLRVEGDESEYIANSANRLELKAGRNLLELTFWGKVIRDRGLDGPYIMTGLRGWRHNGGVTPGMIAAALERGGQLPEPANEKPEPLKEYMEAGPDYGGMAFQAGDFSNSEWDSDLKKNRIHFLEQMALEE